MSESESVDPSGAERVASELAAVADEVAAMYAQLTEDLAALGEPWGDDNPGREFAKTYVPKSRRTLAAGRALVDNMRALSADFAAAEPGSVNQDQTSAAKIMGGPAFGNDAAAAANDPTTGNGTTAPTTSAGEDGAAAQSPAAGASPAASTPGANGQSTGQGHARPTGGGQGSAAGTGGTAEACGSS